jgi:peptide-methionine (S)-S-oxide reductase
MKRPALLVTVLALAAVLMLSLPGSNADAGEITAVPAPAYDPPAPAGQKTADIVFAGGCFWGVQAVFQHARGVTSAVAGYAGGKAMTAQYEMVSTGLTGHAESVHVTYDPGKISTATLMRIFFSAAHDPTTLNRQGPDQGTQYRSAIFFTTGDQAAIARAYIAQLDAAHVFKRPIVTEIAALPGFYAAEAYHQNYLTLHPQQAYITINDIPKLDAFKTLYPTIYLDQPTLVP